MTAASTTRREILTLAAGATGLSLLAAGSAEAQSVSIPGGMQRGPKPKKIGIVLFDGFETPDVFGPVQMWGRLKDYEVVTVREKGGTVTSAQGLGTECRYAFADAPQFKITMIPGGGGTRREVDNPVMLDFLRRQDRGTEWTTSVCTGSAVLAKAGILGGRNATSEQVGLGLGYKPVQGSPLAASGAVGDRPQAHDLLGRLGRHGHGARPRREAVRTGAGRARRSRRGVRLE